MEMRAEWIRGVIDGMAWMAEVQQLIHDLKSWVASERAQGHDLSEDDVRFEVARRLNAVFGIKQESGNG
jgi:glutaredoxin 2